MARYRPKNLVHVVFDNESLLSVGGFPTATSTGSDLEGVARASGIERTKTVKTMEDFTQAFDEALRTDAERYSAAGATMSRSLLMPTAAMTAPTTQSSAQMMPAVRNPEPSPPGNVNASRNCWFR